MFHARNGYAGFSTHFKLFRRRSFCSTKNSNNMNNNNNFNVDGRIDSNVNTYNESYRQLENLDFMTATKILFTHPPKKKKFGIDFHLVQLFFACMPSLAVYLVAQYARYEMRRMEAELEEKNKQEEEVKLKQEEEKANEMELSVTEDKNITSDPELLEVKERLGKLEETVKEIVVESKKQAVGDASKTQQKASEPGQVKSKSESSCSLQQDKHTKQNTTEQTPNHKPCSAAQVSDASRKDQKSDNQN